MITNELRRATTLVIVGLVLFHGHASASASVNVAGSIGPAYTGDDPWELSEPLRVGVTGNGWLTVSGDSQVSSTLGVIGEGAGVTGKVTITGPDAAWANSHSMTVGRYGRGELSILNGGIIGYGGVVFSAFEGSSSSVLVSGSGSRLNTLHTVLVGQEGPSTLTVENGGLVTSDDGWIAGLRGTTSSVLVSGSGSSWAADCDMQVGRFGNGSLTIESGGVVTSDAGAYVGYGDSAVGTALVTGPGSLWGGLVSDLYVGNAGEGTLTITDHAAVIQRMGHIGYLADSKGVVNISDHGTLSIQYGPLMVGYSGEARMTISGGSQVDSHGGRIGFAAGSFGWVAVTGAGSRWNAKRELFVGERGHGQLEVHAGGVIEMSLFGVTIGKYQGSRGEAVISGSGSSVYSADDLIVGEFGAGSLEIGPLGRFDVSGNVSIGRFDSSEGALSLAGGYLDLHGGGLSAGSGVSSFIFTAGELRGARSINLKAPFIQNGGTFAPADGVGMTDVTGDYELVGGIVEVELGGVSGASDLVAVTGNIDIALTGTTLDLSGVGPMLSGTYTVIESTGGTLAGSFEHIAGIGIYEGLVDVAYTANAVLVTLNWDFVPGDLNGDGFVGVADLNTVVTHWNQDVPPADLSSGDFTGDGFVGIDDLNAVLGNWNVGVPPADGSSVPEPAGLMLMGAAGVWLCRRSGARGV